VICCKPTSLRSSSMNMLVIPRSRLKFYGYRAFSVCAPKLWNNLPEHIKCSSALFQFIDLFYYLLLRILKLLLWSTSELVDNNNNNNNNIIIIIIIITIIIIIIVSYPWLLIQALILHTDGTPLTGRTAPNHAVKAKRRVKLYAAWRSRPMNTDRATAVLTILNPSSRRQ